MKSGWNISKQKQCCW